MLQSLNRDSNIKDFLLQLPGESANLTANWSIVSVVFSLLLSVLISQYIPIVPQLLSNYQLLGWEINKFGYTLGAIAIFYLLRSLFSFVFYMSINENKRWNLLLFVSTKFYFVYSIVLMVACVVHYYFDIDSQIALRYYWVFFVFAFVFKILFYLFNKNEILPQNWYYKILYICTLQIIPFVVLWKMLFI